MADPKSFYDSKNINLNKKAVMFNSIYSVYDFIEAEKPKLKGSSLDLFNQIESNIDSRKGNAKWYGTSDPSLVTDTIDSYLFTSELDGFIERLRSKTVATDIRDISQKKKIQFTDKEIGIFSFDLASLGLIRVFEYYSPLLKKIVSANLIKSFVSPSGKRKFYHVSIQKVEKHEVVWSDKGAYYSSVLRKDIPSELLIKEGKKYFYPFVKGVEEHEVERRQKLNKDGKPMFSSTWKKSYINIPKIDNPLPRIDLIINSTYSAGKDGQTEFKWGSMAAITIAEKLQNSKVSFRIFISVCGALNGNRNKIYQFIKVKDENEPLNTNGLATMASDPRFFRTTFFKLFNTIAFELGWGAFNFNGIAYVVNDANEIKSAFVEYLKMSKDFDGNSGKVKEDAKIVLSTDYSEQSAINQYNRVVDQIQNITQASI